MKISDQIDPRYRSLLQKAARRGHVNLVLTISTHIGLSGPTVKRWFTQQTTVTTFRVCWPLVLELNFTRRFSSKVAAMINAARGMGAIVADPFMILSFLALPVIPELKLTDQGLFDVNQFAHVSLFVE